MSDVDGVPHDIAAVHDHLDDCPACAALMLAVVRETAPLAAGSDQSATCAACSPGAPIP